MERISKFNVLSLDEKNQIKAGKETTTAGGQYLEPCMRTNMQGECEERYLVTYTDVNTSYFGFNFGSRDVIVKRENIYYNPS